MEADQPPRTLWAGRGTRRNGNAGLVGASAVARASFDIPRTRFSLQARAVILNLNVGELLSFLSHSSHLANAMPTSSIPGICGAGLDHSGLSAHSEKRCFALVLDSGRRPRLL